MFLSDIRPCSNALNLTFTDTLTFIQIENICSYFLAKGSIKVFVFFALYASVLANLEYCCCYF